MVLNKTTVSYSFDELAIRRTKLPQAQHAVNPPTNDRPNPLVTEAMIYVSVFSPGAVHALERNTGKIVWSREIPKFGGSAAHLAKGRLFVQTANTVHALEPETGKPIWSFCPYGDSGESIYSSPTIYGDSVFIGDRRGYLHCLECRTGNTRWKQRTNKAKNCSLNSTPLVAKGLIIVGTNANMAAAYEPRTGKRVWVRKLDGPSGNGPLICGELVALVTDSIYFLKPESGKLVSRFSWKDDGVTSAATTHKGIVANLRGSWPPKGNVRLVGLNKAKVYFTSDHTAFVAFLRYADATKLIYVSHLEGIDVIRPENGSTACKIENKSRPLGNGPVDVKQNTIYVLTNDGHVYALRHPTLEH
jgi:outer membrane protein assembly factor BamB